LIENQASARLLERVGMRREGLLIQSYWHRDRWANEFTYAIIRDEWLARRKDASAKS
jgi:RimJ/RimL family protein N-acetyltransferase